MEVANELEKLSQAKKNIKHSGYGVILDCNRGHIVGNECLTQIKIIDTSINPKISSNLNDSITQSTQSIYTYINVMIFWTPDTSGEPFVRKIGDIIRFHNFEFSIYNSKLQAKNRKGSSWELYSINGDSSYLPYAKSTESQENNHSLKNIEERKSRIYRLTKWSHHFFGKYSLKELGWYSFDNVPADGSACNFDMLVKIVKMEHNPNGKTCFDVVSEDNIIQYQVYYPTNQIGEVKIGDIVKLRSIEKIQQKLLIPHAKYQAIVPLPKNSLDFKNFNKLPQKKPGRFELGEANEIDSENEKNPVVYDSMKNLNDFNDASMLSEAIFEVAPSKSSNNNLKVQENRYKGFTLTKTIKKSAGIKEIIEGSTILEQYKNLPIKEMSSLILGSIDPQIRKNLMKLPRIRIKGQIWQIYPRNLVDAIRFECQQCGRLRRIDSGEGDICCQKEMKRIWFIKLLLKDQTIRNTKEFLVGWIFSSGDDNPKYIFQEIDIDKLTISNLNDYDQIYKKIIESILNPNKVFDLLLTYFDCGLEILEGQMPFRVVDTMFLQDDL